MPTQPARCLCQRLPSRGGMLVRELERRGKGINAHVTGRLVCHSSDKIVAAAPAGYGLAGVPNDSVAECIAAGRLVPVLDDGSQTFTGYHPSHAGRSSSPALRLVVEALRRAQ